MAKKPAGGGRVDAGYRDAGSGQYVTKKYADAHPKSTVKETKPAAPPPGKKSK